MKERPILFSGPMVRAILDGRKTQTRRVVKPQPPSHMKFRYDGLGDPDEEPDVHYLEELGPDGESLEHYWSIGNCPYGEVGDRLWVQEAHCICSSSGACFEVGGKRDGRCDRYRTTSPRYMPQSIARITLEITDVRVERLQDITEEDAEAEGVEPWSSNGLDFNNYYNSFAALWDTIAKPGAKWMDNPYVWVIGFRREGDKNG